MGRRYLYKTGLLTAGLPHPKEPRPPFLGRGWRAIFRKCSRENVPTTDKELFISAKSRETAQNALDLILAAHMLIEGDPLIFPMDLVAFRDAELMLFDEAVQDQIKSRFMGVRGLYVACAAAAKASARKEWLYALIKYEFSVSLYSNFTIDLDPYHGAKYMPVSPLLKDHILYSHCIISAYSVVEELGLEIRASSKTPSMVGGKWNPPVLVDLESRLKAVGVNLNETLLWTVRGPRRRIEARHPPRTLQKERWAFGPVRDASIRVADAVAQVSWLRSAAASHTVKDFSRALSPYDVANAQHLARRLLLESLGYWKFYF